ncbi:hypothetical protein O0I10_005876 [Lichtheimia ornata]|uniref:Uncharacterized protein n=1 Tax=Lichtheimia ornata TaxID=688661 RepID=A0AAD7XZF5_9FUNG|nr:uncharacterized protein O0I10_005876 [Lichtheimia ornata]KAJ8658523.1 hypothetical protein O0I10_005876 [Lichtheimia ornata]
MLSNTAFVRRCGELPDLITRYEFLLPASKSAAMCLVLQYLEINLLQGQDRDHHHRPYLDASQRHCMQHQIPVPDARKRRSYVKTVVRG